MITNAVVTIYNRARGNKDTFDSWHYTVLKPVHVYVDHKVSVGDSGLSSADVYKIRIPADAEGADYYLPPEEYAEMDNPNGYWTIQNDDYIVLGECAKEIEKPADLHKVSWRNCKVLSWSDNRRGTTPHWRIEGA